MTGLSNYSTTTDRHFKSPHQNQTKSDRGGAKKEEECDAEAWDTLSKSFKQVQCVLDHNSDLIKQVNANHQSKIPDNLVKNVSLIHEINGNITKVMSIYSDLSFNVSNIVEERRRLKNGGESNLESASNEMMISSLRDCGLLHCMQDVIRYLCSVYFFFVLLSLLLYLLAKLLTEADGKSTQYTCVNV
ncbi:hypothetical protein NC651_021993 [Populus alba x Populus x berolinensis]|nr:hypothetical protein NC651_021993 [Populus alba x Populus x berolinensis]